MNEAAYNILKNLRLCWQCLATAVTWVLDPFAQEVAFLISRVAWQYAACLYLDCLLCLMPEEGCVVLGWKL